MDSKHTSQQFCCQTIFHFRIHFITTTAAVTAAVTECIQISNIPSDVDVLLQNTAVVHCQVLLYTPVVVSYAVLYVVLLCFHKTRYSQ